MNQQEPCGFRDRRRYDPRPMWIVLELALFAATAAALVLPQLRALVAKVLGAAAALALVAGFAFGGSAERALELTFSFAAFEGNQLSNRAFPIETTRAPGFAYALLAAAWCGAWAFALFRIRPCPERPAGSTHPFWAPMLLAWTGTATLLGLEKLAAPAGLVQPFAFDRILFPATAAAALLLADRCRAVILTFSWLTLFVSLSRLPIALFGTWATRSELGTSLDVHSVTFFANPFVQRTVTVEPGSTEQLAWLLWGPHLLVMPALYMMSSSGFAIARLAWIRGQSAPPSIPPPKDES